MLKENALPKAASQLFENGKKLYDTYKYEEAKEDLEASYKYEKLYETLYYVAMCYKRLGDTKTAYPYFYDIINNSGDEDLIRLSANYGLDLQKKDVTEQAAKYKY